MLSRELSYESINEQIIEKTKDGDEMKVDPANNDDKTGADEGTTTREVAPASAAAVADDVRANPMDQVVESAKAAAENVRRTSLTIMSNLGLVQEGEPTAAPVAVRATAPAALGGGAQEPEGGVAAGRGGPEGLEA